MFSPRGALRDSMKRMSISRMDSGITTPIVKEGVLQKRSVYSVVAKNWKERRIVLRTDMLEWYEPAEGSLKGAMELRADSSVGRWREPLCLVVTTDHITLVLKTFDAQSEAEWHAALSLTLGKLASAQIASTNAANAAGAARPGGAAPAKKPASLPAMGSFASDAEAVAATRMQSAVRGHGTRTKQQEASRLEWLAHRTAAGEFSEAQALVCSPAEQQALDAVRGRRERVKYLLSLGDATGARQAGWDGRDPPPPQASRCCLCLPACTFGKWRPPPAPAPSVAVTPALLKGVVRIQSGFRGLKTRDGVQARRSIGGEVPARTPHP